MNQYERELVRPPVPKIDYASEAGVVNPEYRRIDCGLGNSPFPFPEQVMEAVRAITENDLAEYPADPYTKGLNELIRRRFRLSDGTRVFIGGQGSYGILATVLSDLVSPQAPTESVKVIGYGPQFTNIVHLTERAGLEYAAVQPPIETSVDSKVEGLTNYLKRLRGGPHVVYVDTPNNPTGQVPSEGTLDDLMVVTARRGDLLIIDEAFGDAMPDGTSSVPMVEKYENLIVVRSMAKVIGLASPRLGWAVMSEKVGGAYDSINLVFSVDTVTARIGRAALDPERLATYLPKVRSMTREVKTALVTGLKEAGIGVHDTEMGVNILLAKGRGKFYRSLLDKGIVTEAGDTFKPTHDEMDESYVRFRIPGDLEQVGEIVERVKSIR